jgi:phosphoribosylformylglycinamidine (FGAM) synthase-like amidotransferase family enzyme
MSARVAVVVFPGTNSEDETLRALRASGVEAEIVHWSRSATRAPSPRTMRRWTR